MKRTKKKKRKRIWQTKIHSATIGPKKGIFMKTKESTLEIFENSWFF